MIRTEGSFRSWSNGNLQCLVEPDGEGQRVRFRTVRGNARPMMFMGLGMMGVSVVGAISTMLVTSISFGDLSQLLTIATTGAVVFALGALPLPRWAKLRQRQMDELAEKLTAPSP